MGKLTFCIVDVFAEEKYAGNQLAVFRGGEGLSSAEMQRIAQEMHYSETAFITSETPHGGGYDVRIFTLAVEVPFAGHPTLGTAHVIRRDIAPQSADKIILNLKVGQIPVTFGAPGDKAAYWMRQIEPGFGQRLEAEALASILGLAVEDIDPRYPIEEVSTGLPFIIVPLKNLAALKRCRIAKEKYFGFIENIWAKAILVFCPETHEPGRDVSVRVFTDYFGIPEDPATGSGQGCLAAYLARHLYWGRPTIDVRSEQGYEVGRPSLLFLKAEEGNGHITVFVGGNAVTIARGEFI